MLPRHCFIPILVLLVAGGCSPGDDPMLAECTEGATGCYDGTRQITCVDGAWGEPEPCADQTCSVDRCAGECGEGQVRCGGSNKEICGADGTWKVAAVCDVRCELVEGTPACTGCQEGATECVDLERIRTCRDGNWGFPAVCTDQTCLEGACAGVCAQGQTQCGDAANGVLSCLPDGTWGAEASCDAGDGWTWQVCRDTSCVDSPELDIGYADVSGPGWMSAALPENQWRTHSVTFAEPVRAFRLAVYLSDVSAGTRVKLALWSNNAGPFGDQPGALVSASMAVDAVTGWNVIPLEYADAPTPLDPDTTYWLGMVATGSQAGAPVLRYQAGTGRNANLNNTWDTPDPFPVVRASDDGHRYGVYAVVKYLD